MKKVGILFLFCLGLLSSCEKNDDSVEADVQETYSIYKDWVLVAKETLQNQFANMFSHQEDPYPITLVFYNDHEICGTHDPNLYLGSYTVENNTVSFSIVESTDGTSFATYWDYMDSLSNTYQFEFLTEDTLVLHNEEASFQMTFLSKALYSQEYLDIDSLYHYYDGCQPDTSTIQNTLQGSFWVLFSMEETNMDQVYEEMPPLSEGMYPITLSINDSMVSGMHGTNYYTGDFQLEENEVQITSLSGTEMVDLSWNHTYYTELHQVDKMASQRDSLKLFDGEENIQLYFLDKTIFNEIHYDIDSLYGE